MIRKILVANRGEIALRIMRTARRLGIETIAIYSEADRNAPFTRYADEAVCVGPPPSSESYLRSEHIIEIAIERGADAIHPGYGFLSENANFAEAVEKSEVKFIGPHAEAIRIMGSKLDAKEAVKEYDIPLVPGLNDAVTDIEAAKDYADSIGYPVLIKASAGGGGKGMRIVHEPEKFEEQMDRAVSEAKSSFGDGSVFVEKYITSPKHIEIQILADEHGNVRHINERECSIQRRHQKVIEEAPSPVVDDALREQMGRDAIGVAKACGYTGAGTVEFIMDEDKNYYFLEMNTRLQVEHPVTEMTTGMDLVEWQIRIADGEPIDFEQSEVPLNGHAIELRVYAEDPFNNFLPDLGSLDRYRPPKGDHIRIDDGFEEGMNIPIHYDPMIAKLIAWGENRSEAIERLKEAIRNYEIKGATTTLPFGTFVLEHPEFILGTFDTHFVDEHFTEEKVEEWLAPLRKAVAHAALRDHLDHWKNDHIPKHTSHLWQIRRKTN